MQTPRRLIGGHLYEEFLERRAFQAHFAQTPAVIENRFGSGFAHVIPLLGAEGGGNDAVGLTIENFDLTHAR